MDAMTGRGELGDRGLVAAFYGRGGLADGRTLRSAEAWTGRTGADYEIPDTADCGRWGGLGRTGWTEADRANWGGRGGRGRIGSSLEGRKGRIGKHGAGVTADWV